MAATGTNDTTLVVAARAGDRRALDELITAHLPMVYTIVRRALSGHPDADDVVQETMLRALRELRELRAPESFRAWLAAIAIRQVSTHLHRRHLAAQRTTPLDEIAGAPDAAFENLTMLELELSGQRRQVARAGQWLDSDDRTLLSLWWLELAGQLSRTELAAAIGVSVAHAGVRVQRMRNQLEAARSLEAALDARPRCAELRAVLAGWNGRPNPLWRKRIARHTRSCAVCARATSGIVATERLLVGFALLPVPLALTAALLGKGSAFVMGTSAAVASGAAAGGASGGLGVSVKAGVLSHLAQAAAAHPVVAALVAGTVIAGAAVTTTNWPTTPPPAPTVIVAPTASRPTRVSPDPPVSRPSPTPTRVPTQPASRMPGPVSLEAVNEDGFFVSTTDTYGVLTPVDSGSDSQARRRATFSAVAGLANAACFSFRLPDGQYLRHSSWRLRVNANDGTELFRGDATFCVRAGSEAGSVSLESSNYPGWFLRHRGNELWVDSSDGSAAFRADSSFRIRPALVG